MKKLKNSNCDKTHIVTKLKLGKTSIVKKLNNLKFYQTQKLKFGLNLKTQIVMKLKNSKCDKTQTLKL